MKKIRLDPEEMKKAAGGLIVPPTENPSEPDDKGDGTGTGW